MINLTLKDGKIITAEVGTTCLQAAASISEGLARMAMAAEVDGKLVDLSTPLTEDAALSILTFADEGGRLAHRHTASHVLAQAVLRLYPDTKLAIGPAIKDGFYYDFDSDITFTPEVLEKIEAEMRKIISEKLPIESYTLPREDALAFVAGNPYKVALIQDLPLDEPISFYRQGEFTDLCAGPHLQHTGQLKANAMCLLNATGAYWRGDAKNKMLQRIYGTSFPKKAELDEHLERLEEAKKRDHRKLGRELGLFLLRDEGPGFPFFLPHGMTVKNELIDYWREIHRKAGYQEIGTPVILGQNLWERSGHWGHYSNNMYTTDIDELDFAIKPMNCPGGILVYESEPRSYRDLPYRVGELGLVHRHELSGALHGLMRVRSFTQDDAHIFMTEEQIKDEIVGVLHLVDEIYRPFGFKYHIELSTMPEDHMGEVETWDRAIAALKAALDEVGKDYIINEGDGAFYGPKIDFHLEDCIGRTWQCGTIQLDMNLPERFDLEYIGPDGEKHRPVMIHRAIFGSIERFIGILIEHFAGAFPTWLAPVQARVMPITDRAKEAAQAVADQLEAAGIRTETDFRNEKIGYKIREAQVQKVPYMLVLGDREVETGEVSVRTRTGGDQGSMPVEQFIAQIREEIVSRAKT
ncbi:MAG: threonine--tRNA ligase [Oscillospiraceae bacterium]|nr:threonine--tRNA ligase [Oscillospiraceae bacterium]